MLKPFNLKEALAGASVVTRSGIPVRIICTDKKSRDEVELVGLIDYGMYEETNTWEQDGRFWNSSHLELDLFMKVKTKKLWLAVSKESLLGLYSTSCAYEDKEKSESLCRPGIDALLEIEIEV